MTKAWGSAGSWAADSELAEAKIHDPEPQQRFDDASFPSLGEAAASKSKKKKPQTFTLAQLSAVGADAGHRAGKPHSFLSGESGDDNFVLPTGPRDRSGEDDQSGRLGGGFKDYGAYRGGRQGGDREKDRSFGDGYGRKAGTEEPSRADDSDNWGASKKPSPAPYRGAYDDDARRGSYDDDRRRGSRMMTDDNIGSKADADDNWASNKKATPSPMPLSPGRSTSRRYEDHRAGSFFDSHHSSRADDVGDWVAAKKSAASLPPSDSHRSGRTDQERSRLGIQNRTYTFDSLPSSVSGSDADSTARASDGSEQDLTSPKKVEEASKPRRPNPFGDAKPREVLLEQKGMDWRKLDASFEQHSFQRSETEEEIQLKKEIKELQEIIRAGSQGTGGASEHDNIDVKEELAKNERNLEQLTRALNDNARSAQTGRASSTGDGRTRDVWTRSVSGEREKKNGRW